METQVGRGAGPTGQAARSTPPAPPPTSPPHSAAGSQERRTSTRQLHGRLPPPLPSLPSLSGAPSRPREERRRLGPTPAESGGGCPRQGGDDGQRDPGCPARPGGSAGPVAVGLTRGGGAEDNGCAAPRSRGGGGRDGAARGHRAAAGGGEERRGRRYGGRERRGKRGGWRGLLPLSLLPPSSPRPGAGSAAATHTTVPQNIPAAPSPPPLPHLADGTPGNPAPLSRLGGHFPSGREKRREAQLEKEKKLP